MEALGCYGSDDLDDHASLDGRGTHNEDSLLAPAVPLTEPPSANDIFGVDNMMDLDLDNDPLDTLSWDRFPADNTLNVPQSLDTVPTSVPTSSSSSSFIFYIPPGPQASTSAPSSVPTSSTRYNIRVCDICGREVHVDLHNPDYKWGLHRTGKDCKKRVRQNERSQKQREEEEALERRRRSLSMASEQSHSRSRTLSISVSDERSISFARRQSATGEVEVSYPCPGVEPTWPAGYSSYDYPARIHSFAPNKYNFRPYQTLWPVGAPPRLFLRSLACREVAASDGGACPDCLAVLSSSGLQELQDRATREPMPHANPESLSHPQLQKLVHRKDDLLRIERSKVQGLERRMETATGTVSTYRRMVHAISDGDVKRVDAVLRVAIRQNASPDEILERLGKAARGVYAAKSFGKREKDFVLFMKRIGGGANGVYALSKMFGLPSMTSVRGSRSARLKLSVSSITADDIISNLLAFVGPLISDASKSKTGCSLFWDGFHITPKARKVGDEAGGLCREHAPNHDVSLKDIETVRKLARAVHLDKTCHYGSEATVFFLGPLREENYAAIPMIVSPSCKTEKGPQLAATISLMMDLYEIYAKPHLGPLFMTSTDGDGVYRAAQHELLTRETPAFGTPLHTALSSLDGFNMTCGKNQVVFGPDPKHVIKRSANLLRSQDGMLVLTTPITRTILKRWIAKLPWHDAVSVDNLTDPGDHQNVPKAVKLLRTISMIPKEIPHRSEMDPDEAAEHRALDLIGELWSHLYNAFICPTLSLTEQLEKLSVFAHLATELYRRHTGSLMSAQLYYDSQSLVKSCFFYAIRQKILDPDKRVLIFHVGSDRGERKFCCVRIATHNTNPDALELADSLSEDSDMDRIIEENPDLNKEHRRTSWTSSPNIDHVNPTFYKGNLRAGDCRPTYAWDSGRRIAQEILRRFGVDVDFRALFQTGVNIQQPFGDGKYPGVSAHDTVDRSIINNGTPAVPFTAQDLLDALEPEASDEVVDGQASPSPPPPPTTESLNNSGSSTVPSDILLASSYSVTPEEDSDESDDSDGEDEDRDELDLLATSTSQLEEPDLERLEEQAASIELRDLLCDPDDQHILKTSMQNENDWFTVCTSTGATRYIHKASVIRLLFSDDGCRLSSDRLLRVRGYRRDGPIRRQTESEELIDGDVFTVGQLAIVAVRSETIISLALMKVMQIDSDKRKRLDSVSASKLGTVDSSLTVFGYVYDLVPAIPLPSTSGADLELDAAELNETPLDLPPDRIWVSPANFIRFTAVRSQRQAKSSNKPGRKSTKKPAAATAIDGSKAAFTLRVPGAFAVPILAPAKTSVFAVPEEKRARLSMIGSSDTYSFKESELLSILERFVSRKDHSALKKIKNIKRSDSFPYACADTNNIPFIVSDLGASSTTDAAPARDDAPRDGDVVSQARDKKHCRLCNATINGVEGNSRGHTSRHLCLALQCSMEETDLIDTIDDRDPCGFCGGNCPVLLERTRTSWKVLSDCFWSHAFQYNSAAKGGAVGNPSTNVPVICTICHPGIPKNGTTYPAIWKYNLPLHVQSAHPEMWDSTLQSIIRDADHKALWEATTVSESEKQSIIAWMKKRTEKRSAEDAGGPSKRARTSRE